MKAGDTRSPSRYSGESPEEYATVKVLGSLSKLPSGGRLDKELTVGAPVKLSDLLSFIEKEYRLTLWRHSTLILVNGVEANALKDLDTVVHEGDLVCLIPMFHGG